MALMIMGAADPDTAFYVTLFHFGFFGAMFLGFLGLRVAGFRLVSNRRGASPIETGDRENRVQA